MNLSRNEVNFRRLLAKCELMCKENKKDDERMPKYVDSLEDMFQEVKKTTDSSYENIAMYQRRISSLKSNLGITSNKYETENEAEADREKLLGVRHRNNYQNSETRDADEVINFNEKVQSKITDDMLALTSNLKQQSQLANRIIRKDTEVVNRSAQLTDQNYTKLHKESNKLAEHSKRACRCWMWVMLLVVVVVFVNMVLFMKVMKKK